MSPSPPAVSVRAGRGLGLPSPQSPPRRHRPGGTRGRSSHQPPGTGRPHLRVRDAPGAACYVAVRPKRGRSSHFVDERIGCGGKPRRSTSGGAAAVWDGHSRRVPRPKPGSTAEPAAEETCCSSETSHRARRTSARCKTSFCCRGVKVWVGVGQHDGRSFVGQSRCDLPTDPRRGHGGTATIPPNRFTSGSAGCSSPLWRRHQ